MTREVIEEIRESGWVNETKNHRFYNNFYKCFMSEMSPYVWYVIHTRMEEIGMQTHDTEASSDWKRVIELKDMKCFKRKLKIKKKIIETDKIKLI